MEGPALQEIRILLPSDADPDQVVALLQRVHELGWSVIAEPEGSVAAAEEVEAKLDPLDQPLAEIVNAHEIPEAAKAINGVLEEKGLGILRDVILVGYGPFTSPGNPVLTKARTLFTKVLEEQDPPITWTRYADMGMLLRYCADLSKIPAVCLTNLASLYGLSHKGRVSVADILDDTRTKDFYTSSLGDAMSESFYRMLRHQAERFRAEFDRCKPNELT